MTFVILFSILPLAGFALAVLGMARRMRGR
jgi:hypothetical protein